MERDIGEIKEYIVVLLSDLINEREQNNIQPLSVEMTAIQNALISDAKAALNKLCSEQVLTFYKTLNDVAFEFTPPK